MSTSDVQVSRAMMSQNIQQITVHTTIRLNSHVRLSDDKTVVTLSQQWTTFQRHFSRRADARVSRWPTFRRHQNDNGFGRGSTVVAFVTANTTLTVMSAGLSLVCRWKVARVSCVGLASATILWIVPPTTLRLSLHCRRCVARVSAASAFPIVSIQKCYSQQTTTLLSFWCRRKVARVS